jgi:hypothetical protein
MTLEGKKANVVLFWTSYKPEIHTDIEKWVDYDVKISPLHFLSLLSHLEFDNNVVIYTYQMKLINNIPDGISVKDASEFLDTEFAFQSLQSGHSIAHISDAVRFYGAIQNDGIVLDMDAVCVNPIPDVGCFFSSMPAKKTGGMAQKWGENNPPLIVNDDSWDGKGLSVFPVKVNEKISEGIGYIAEEIIERLGKDPSESAKGWNFVMWALKDLPKLDPKAKTYPPIKNCPIPGWMPKGKCYSLEFPTRLDGKTEIFGHKLPSVAKILTESTFVQHFFETTFKKIPVSSNDFWLHVKQGSLLGQEALHVLGNDWRKILMDNVTKYNVQQLKIEKSEDMEMIKLSQIIPNPDNPRTISDQKLKQLKKSLKEFPKMMEIRPIVVDENWIALGGNQRRLGLEKLGYEEIPSTWVRQEKDLTDEEKLEFIIKDNASFGEWDWTQLNDSWDQIQIQEWGLDLPQFDTTPVDEENKDENYTRKVDSPVYEPKNEKPSIKDLVDIDKVKQLQKQIDESDLPEDEKEFLKIAATRHYVFDFRSIADYYANSDKKSQELMENSALVIIDFDKAIENGYIEISKTLTDVFKEDYDEE